MKLFKEKGVIAYLYFKNHGLRGRKNNVSEPRSCDDTPVPRAVARNSGPCALTIITTHNTGFSALVVTFNTGAKTQKVHLE